MAKHKKKKVVKKIVKSIKSTKPTKVAKSVVKRKTLKRPIVSDNFRNYNTTKSAVREYLQSKGISYTGKDLLDYTSNIYKQIKTKAGGKGMGKAFLDNAFKNIDVFVEQHFYQPPFVNRVDFFDWWFITDEVNFLSANTYIIVDSSEILPKTSPNVYFEGKANDWHSVSNAFNNEMNGILLREKVYPKYVKIFFRDDEKKKEFFYFLLVDDNNELVSENLEYTQEELLTYITTNYIFDIEAVFNRIPYKTNISSLKATKVAKTVKKKGKPAKAVVETKITKKDKEKQDKKEAKRILSGLTKKEFNAIGRELFSKKKKK